MAVEYLETESYSFDQSPATVDGPQDMTVHLILSGPLYRSFDEADRQP